MERDDVYVGRCRKFRIQDSFEVTYWAVMCHSLIQGGFLNGSE
jgi:hypothetical protein